MLPLLALTACGNPSIEVYDLDSADAAACAAFAGDLPATLFAKEQVDTDTSGDGEAYGAAYGDPAITVTCGVPKPKGWGVGASCELVNDVGWFIPDDQYGDEPIDLTLTAAGYLPRVQVRIPADYWPDGGPAAMAVLAKPIKAHLKLESTCP